jgi:prepilin-type N-terminal cleavage/methylation domain-containing protein
MKNKRGFTLLELIVIIALASVVMLAVMSFLITNYRSYNVINTVSELQYQSQYTINYITEKILEANKFESNTFYYNDNSESIFTFNEHETRDEYKNRIEFYHKDKYGNETSTPVGGYVVGFDIDISPTAVSEVVIELTLQKDKSGEYTVTQTVYLRNFK